MLKEDLAGGSAAMPDSVHSDIVLRIIKRGIHVLVQRPPAIAVAECERGIEAFPDYTGHRSDTLTVESESKTIPPLL
jgi:hypothetical protein